MGKDGFLTPKAIANRMKVRLSVSFCVACLNLFY